MSPYYHRHSPVIRAFICTILIVFALLLVPPTLPAGESIIESELREAVKELDVYINVRMIPNAETKKQDLYITPASGYSYSGGTFVYAVARGVSDVVSKSFTYQLYLGMVLIDINNELLAISAENCRKIFKLNTAEEQTRMLQQSLKRLR